MVCSDRWSWGEPLLLQYNANTAIYTYYRHNVCCDLTFRYFMYTSQPTKL